MSKFVPLTFVADMGGTEFMVNMYDLVMVQSTVGLEVESLRWVYDSIPADANAFVQVGREHARGYFVQETVIDIREMLTWPE